MNESHPDCSAPNPASLWRQLRRRLSSLSPSSSHQRRSWGEERWSCVLSRASTNKPEAFQPSNLSYSAGFRLLFLLFKHHNKSRSRRGRLWRLQQTAALYTLFANQRPVRCYQWTITTRCICCNVAYTMSTAIHFPANCSRFIQKPIDECHDYQSTLALSCP